MTQGNLPGIKPLYQGYRESCQWLMLYVRDAHPGEKLHASYEQKPERTYYFRDVENVSWPVLVDELDGRVHQQFGLLPNSVFLIDTEGRVSFVGDISHGPALRKTLQHLFEQGGRGPVPEGEDKTPLTLGLTAYGWEALKRGGRANMRNVALRMSPLTLNLWLGNKSKLFLNPIASRSRSLSSVIKLAVGLGAGALLGLAAIRTIKAVQSSRHDSM